MGITAENRLLHFRIVPLVMSWYEDSTIMLERVVKRAVGSREADSERRHWPSNLCPMVSDRSIPTLVLEVGTPGGWP
eukprot:1379405-Rhodomonas_salina.1